MRPGPSSRALSAAASWGCKISSWLGSTLLEDEIPVTSGRVSAVADQQVPETLRFTVPRFTVEQGRTVDWRPATPDAPLAKNGQILDVTITSEGVDSRIGRFLLTQWEENGGEIDVTGVGLLQTAADDRLTTSMAPRDDGTLKSEFARLLPEYLTVIFDPALVNRPVPKGMEWREDRIGALYEIADAWPARIRMSPWGQVLVMPPLPAQSAPVLTLTDGEDGTVISAPTSERRSGTFNMVVARSTADGVDAQAIASVLSGPLAPSGEYRPVPKFFSSPLLPDQDACATAARTMLADAIRPAKRVQIEMAPDPRIELDDPIEAYRDRGTPRESRDWGYVYGYDLPLTVGDGAARIDVAVF